MQYLAPHGLVPRDVGIVLSGTRFLSQQPPRQQGGGMEERADELFDWLRKSTVASSSSPNGQGFKPPYRNRALKTLSKVVWDDGMRLAMNDVPLLLRAIAEHDASRGSHIISTFQHNIRVAAHTLQYTALPPKLVLTKKVKSTDMNSDERTVNMSALTQAPSHRWKPEEDDAADVLIRQLFTHATP